MSLIAHDVVEDVVRAGGTLSQSQDSAELAAFLAARVGKLTASNMWKAMDFLKTGKPSQKRNDYMREILAERITGLNIRHYVNPAMEWGIATEAEAKEVYARLTGFQVEPAGVLDHKRIENFAATPDGIVLPVKRLLEVKCPTTTTFIDWRIANVVPEEHRPQMLAQCACSGFREVDFFAYDPRIKEEKKRYLLLTYRPGEAEIQAVETMAEQFLEEVDAMFEAFVTA